MSELKVGDVVRLKSGGPKMTVEDVKPNPAGIICTWFGEAEITSSYFQPQTLEKVQESKKKKTPARRKRRLSLDELD